MALRVVPVTFKAACRFVAEHHRHHRAPRGMKFAIGVEDDGRLCGVAIIGRPISRVFDDGLTAEVTRTCTDGTRNANSLLYGAARAAAKAMGYRRIVTYTEDGESGSSLKAAAFWRVKELPALKNWAESSVRLRAKRDPAGRGGVARGLWEWRA
jgi:hypothetical protein